MKNLSILTLLLFSIVPVTSIAQLSFVKVYPVQSESAGKAAVKTTDGNLILGGTTISSSSDTEIVILKVDITGNVLWSKILTASHDQDLTGMIATRDSGFALLSVSLGERSTSLIKIDSSGNLQWAESFTDLYPFSVIQTHDDGFCITGGSWFPVPLNSEKSGKIIKTDMNGDTLWTKTHDDGFMGYDITQIIQNFDSTYTVSEIVWQLDIGHPWMAKLAQDGHLLTKISPPHFYDEYKDMVFCKTSSSDYFISGATWEAFMWGYGLIKLDSMMKLTWFKMLPVPEGSPTHAISQARDGNILLLQKNQLIKADTAGNVMWSQRLNGIVPNGKNSMTELQDGSVLLCGSIYDSTAQTYRICLARFDSSGGNCQSYPYAISYSDTISLYIEDTVSNEIQSNYYLYDDSISIASVSVTTQGHCLQYAFVNDEEAAEKLLIYPNPTSGKIVVNSSALAGETTIKIFSALGEQVFSWKGATDNRETQIDLYDFPSGIYFIHATDGKKVWRGKVIKE